MAEHFALQQITTERRTVNCNKCFPLTTASLMDGLCKDFFTCTGFARQQNGNIGLSYFTSQCYRFLNSRRLSYNCIKRILLTYGRF